MVKKKHKIVILEETAEIIKKLAKGYADNNNISIGEMIDKYVLTFETKDTQMFTLLAFENISIITSKQTTHEKDNTYLHLMAYLLFYLTYGSGYMIREVCNEVYEIYTHFSNYIENQLDEIIIRERKETVKNNNKRRKKC